MTIRSDNLRRIETVTQITSSNIYNILSRNAIPLGSFPGAPLWQWCKGRRLEQVANTGFTSQNLLECCSSAGLAN